jgi:hypothetical protein
VIEGEGRINRRPRIRLRLRKNHKILLKFIRLPFAPLPLPLSPFGKRDGMRDNL